MPYRSEAQMKYFNSHRKELEKEGVNVDEWNNASKGLYLKERVKRIAKKKLKKDMLDALTKK